MKLIEALKTGEPDTMAQSIDREVNNLLFPYKEAAKTICSDKEASACFKVLAAEWMKQAADDYTKTYRYDERNQYSCKVCSDLLDTCFIQRSVEVDFEQRKIARKAVQNLSDMHRTLKQTFSSLIFHYLIEEAKNDVNVKQLIEYANTLYGRGWEKCPLI